MRLKPHAITLILLGLAAGCADRDPTWIDLPGPSASVLPTGGLAAHYDLNGDAEDLGPAGLSGVVHGATGVVDRFGIDSGALEFDGNGDLVLLPGASTDGIAEGTINVWARFDVAADRAECGRPDGPDMTPFPCQYNIYAKADASGSPVFRAQLGSPALGAPNDRFGFSVTSAGWSYSQVQSVDFSAWHMYTFAWSGSEQRLYFDGALVGTGSRGGISPTGGSLYLGNNSSSTLGHREQLKGGLDDLRIFHRLLTGSEIQELFAEMPDPETRDQCLRGGWQIYGFANQGLCIRFIRTGKDAR